MKIKNVEIKNPVVLAPLAGYTNSAYRSIYKDFGVGLVFSEMISARGLLYENNKTWELTEISETEHPIALQLFGGEAENVSYAARMIEEKTSCDIIDINMGCPVRKVLKADSGCMLLTNPDKIYKIVSETVKSVKKPVSVKIRAGWDHEHINCIEVAKAIEKAGASMITIHGRTKSDLYGGKVNLNFIRMVKENVSIPVIGNGDIKSIEDAVLMMETAKADMIMVGRASFGNPWLIRDLVDYFSGRPVQPKPTIFEKVDMCRKHFNRLLLIKPERQAVLEMRSLAAWYVKGLPNIREFKQKLVNVTRKDELFSLLDNIELQ